MTVDSTPYRWPYSGAIDRSGLAVVICGAGPTWARRTPLAPEVEARIAELRQAATDAGIITVLVHHDEPARGFPAAVTESPSLEATTDEVSVFASGIDGFYGSNLDVVLRRARVHQLVFAGRGFETAVHSTLRSANDAGYECLTIHDACASTDFATRAGAVSSIEMSGGIFGAVATSAAFLSALRCAQ